MFTINKALIKIDIQLNNGVYYFDEELATGKTRLTKLLRGYMQDFPVSSYSYDDLVAGLDFDKVVKPSEQKLLVIDRYDLYKGRFKEQIEKLAKTGIVILDCNGDPLIPCELCYLNMQDDKIEVYD